MEFPLTGLVVDDNRPFHRDFIALCHENKLLRNLKIVHCSTTCRGAIRFLLQHGPVDVVFCDIELKDENGLDEAEKFFGLTSFFLLITVYEQHKARAWGKRVHGYIMKPVDAREIRDKLDDLVRIRRLGKIMDDTDRTVFIKDVNEPAPIKVKLDDILSVTVDNNQTNTLRIVTPSRIIMHRKSLKAFKKKFLETGLLVQLDQSTLVGKRHVAKVVDEAVFLTNDFLYPVSKRHRRVLPELVHFLARRKKES